MGGCNDGQLPGNSLTLWHENGYLSNVREQEYPACWNIHVAVVSEVELFVLVMEKKNKHTKTVWQGQECRFSLFAQVQLGIFMSPFLGKISMIWSLGDLTKKNKTNASKMGANLHLL